MKKVLLSSLFGISLFAGDVSYIIKGKLITGADFDNIENKKTNMPLTLTDSNNCIYLGSGEYNVITERINITLNKKSCMNQNKEIQETNVEGFVSTNNSAGIKADKVIYDKKIPKIIEKDNQPAYIDENFKIIVATLLGGKDVELIITKESKD